MILSSTTDPQAILDMNLAALAKTSPRQVEKLCSVQTGTLLIRMNVSAQQSVWQGENKNGIFSREAGGSFQSLHPDKKLYVLYGFGDGYFLKTLLSKEEIKELLVFEPSLSLMKDLFKQVDLSQLLQNPKLRLIVGDQTASYSPELDAYFKEKIERISYAGNFGNFFTN